LAVIRNPSEDWSRYAVRADRGLELLHAHFTTHVYDRHSHDAYVFGVTLDGVQAFTCRGAAHASAAGEIMAFNPDDPHDGHAGSADGFTYRMLYLAPRTVEDALEDAFEKRVEPPLFLHPVIADAPLARAIAAAHSAFADGTFAGGAGRLEEDARLARAILALATRHGSRARPLPRSLRNDRAVGRARDYLHARFAGDIAADELAREAGMSRFHLCRLFARAHGLSPHRYLMRIRLAEAKRLLALGERPAEVAVAVGLVDQSHLTKRFRRAFGITPGQFRKAALRA
jgi:AraC-like DNA-binding protein